MKWRLSHSVLTSDIITFLNDPLMAFSILEFSSSQVCHYLQGDMGGGGEANQWQMVTWGAGV